MNQVDRILRIIENEQDRMKRISMVAVLRVTLNQMEGVHRAKNENSAI